MEKKEQSNLLQEKQQITKSCKQHREVLLSAIKYASNIKALNFELRQTTIQEQTTEKVQKQKSNLLTFIEEKKCAAKDKKIEEMKQNIKNKSYLMEMVNHYIYEIADRNQALDANYAHFLMLLYLTIEEIVLNICASDHLIKAQKFILSKLQTERIKKQLKQSLYYEFLTFVLRKDKINVTLLHAFMRKIMTDQRQICVAVFPYYFNLFAFVLNKQVIFNQQLEQNLIPYTFEIITENRYKCRFSRQQVFKEIRRIEKQTIDRYHSPQL